MKMVEVKWNCRDNFIDVRVMQDNEKELIENGELKWYNQVEKNFWSGDEAAYILFADTTPEEEMLNWIINYDRNDPIYETNKEAIYRLHYTGGIVEINY